ncbi:hypothetical protein GCM10009087_51200 [Sphingomonas oligophenolica]|uniref:Crp/Fnr family transcriptional regulator n=2 Tax=Sphingomonas oligophenolica TaxID=301154 RepID=A0ABU9Y668_9SPHN
MPDTRSADFDLLKWLDPETQAAFLRAVRHRDYRAGQIIYIEGDHGDEMFRIAHGSVKLSLSREDGRHFVLLHLEESGCFGDSSLVDGGERPQTAQASSDTRLQVLDKAAFDQLREHHPSFSYAVMRLLAFQMRSAAFHYVNRNLDNLQTRVVSRLLQMLPPADAAGSAITLRLSQADLALMVGGSRQHVNRVIKRLEGLGLVSVSYGAISTSDRDALAALLRGDCH